MNEEMSFVIQKVWRLLKFKILFNQEIKTKEVLLPWQDQAHAKEDILAVPEQISPLELGMLNL